MAIAVNLTLMQQLELEKVFKGFEQNNEDFLYKFFQQTEPIKPLCKLPDILNKKESVPPPVKEGDFDTEIKAKSLEDKIDALNKRLDLIFGNHVLIDGKMVDVSKIINQ